MDEVKELKNPLIGVGKTVDVVFGEPIKMEDLLLKCVANIKRLLAHTNDIKSDIFIHVLHFHLIDMLVPCTDDSLQ